GSRQPVSPTPQAAPRQRTGPLEQPVAPAAAPVTAHAPRDAQTLAPRADHSAADRGDDIDIPSGPPAPVVHAVPAGGERAATLKAALQAGRDLAQTAQTLADPLNVGKLSHLRELS